jgi:serine/threonine protein kinase/tetratricopeptide (TPR) repeat protein
MPSPFEFAGTPRFEIIRRIGAGGMGVVYEAYDRERRNAVALKTLRDGSAASIRRLKNEFRSLTDLDHPNLVRLGELFNDRDQWFFTMELVGGVDFLAHVCPALDPCEPTFAAKMGHEDSLPSDALVTLPRHAGARAPVVSSRRPHRRLDEARLRAAFPQLVAGVAALHASGKIHRDIKPSNVLVEDDGRVVLLDFGLVADLDSEEAQTMDEAGGGTLAYMAPEQALGRPPEEPVDWYSVGVVLYVALAGSLPFEGPVATVLQAKIQGTVRRPSERAPNVPRDLESLCMRLLSVDPIGRPTSAEMAQSFACARPSLPPSHTSSVAKPFVGRAAELDRLRAAYRSCTEGRPVAIAVGGPSGIGKTALVGELLAEIGAEAMVLRGRSYERETVSYKAFDGIMSELARRLRRLDGADALVRSVRDIGSLAKLFPELLLVPAIASEARPANPLAGDEIRRRAFVTLRELLDALAERKPLVLFFDDLQWADAASLGLLEEIVLGLRSAVLIVAAVRTQPGQDVRGALEAMAARESRASVTGVAGLEVWAFGGQIETIDVGPLPESEAYTLCRMLADAAGVDLGARGAAMVVDAGGHPMFIDELVRAQLDAGDRLAPGRAPRLDEVIWSRVCELEAPARRLLEVVAVAGAPVAQDLAIDAAEMAAAEGGRWLNLLRVRQLVVLRGRSSSMRVDTYHDRVREAVLEHLGEAPVAVHHFRWASVLQAHGLATHQPQLLVRHLLAAGEHERAAAHAVRAAALTLEALDFDQAAEFYRIAVEHGRHDAATTTRLRLQHAGALRSAGRAAEAAAEYLRIAEAADSATRIECRSEAATQLILSGHVAEGLRTLETVAAELGHPLAETRAGATASLLWQRLRLRARGFAFRLRDASEVPASEIARIAQLQRIAETLAFVDAVRGTDYNTRALILAFRSGELHRILRALAGEILMRAGVGRTDDTDALHARLLALVDEHVPERESLLRYGVFAFKRFCEGRFDESRAFFEESDRTYHERPFEGFTFAYYNFRLFALMALRHAGRLAEALALTEEVMRDAARRGNRYMQTCLGRAMSACWLADDRPEVVRVELERPSWVPPEGGFHIQHYYELIARIELGLYVGDPEGTFSTTRALRAGYERSLVPRLVSARTTHAWLCARLALGRAWAGADRGAMLKTVARMAHRLEREGLPSTRAWAEMVRAGEAELRGEASRAAERYARAAAFCEENAMLGYAATAARASARVRGDGLALHAAEERLRSLGVKRPERFAEVFVPGPPQ